MVAVEAGEGAVEATGRPTEGVAVVVAGTWTSEEEQVELAVGNRGASRVPSAGRSNYESRFGNKTHFFLRTVLYVLLPDCHSSHQSLPVNQSINLYV